jgi:hypothetical protein
MADGWMGGLFFFSFLLHVAEGHLQAVIQVGPQVGGGHRLLNHITRHKGRVVHLHAKHS